MASGEILEPKPTGKRSVFRSIPQPVGAAVFGLAQTPCVAGLCRIQLPEFSTGLGILGHAK